MFELLPASEADRTAVVAFDPDPGLSYQTVELNGRGQWITVRGHDANKPVLLFLAGGPGSQLTAAARKQLGELEKHFVVVNWDQLGAGKSYHAADFATLTPAQYIADADALIRYLQ